MGGTRSANGNMRFDGSSVGTGDGTHRSFPMLSPFPHKIENYV